MSTQKDVFLANEADAWFKRNSDNSNKQSPSQNSKLLIEVLKTLEVSPKNILEIGCSSGYNLDQLHNIFEAECVGIDPSEEAVRKGKNQFESVDLKVGTADKLEFAENSFDLIVFGFCLYLCDRSDLFKIAYEADRCLRDNGYLIIIDFYPNIPFKNVYSHCSGIYSYKMKYADMFLWNPEYQDIYSRVFTHYGVDKREDPNEKVCINVLHKNSEFAYLLGFSKE